MPVLTTAGLPLWGRYLLVGGWLLVPLLLGKWDYGLHVLIMVGVYVVLALSLNLVNGMAGQLNLGHAAFFGIGSYITALLMVEKAWPFWATLPLAFVISGMFGLLVGLPALRVSGDYLGIVTLGFGEITRLVLINWIDVTHGPMGVPGIPAPTLFGYAFSSKAAYFYLVTLLAAATWWVMDRLAVSKIGLEMLALKEDERVAQALGINVGRVKLQAFAIGACFAGLAGAFYAVYISFISPDSFLFNDSAVILCMVVLGGMGSVLGSVVGAVILIIAPEGLRFLGSWRMVLYGILLTVMMVRKPSGIWGLERRVRNAIRLTAGG
ncbi:MAG: putative high-affinity branched-chain amino acid transporter, permease protein [Firmicutes bacterium]|nr:putative high-affinity branched-chain amino acid transporter, permease protein [Bacillota bacterium]